GNLRGARKVYITIRTYLDDYPPAYLGLDLGSFLDQYANCFAPLLSCGEEIPATEVDPDLIPEIHLDPTLGCPD
ncbi:MAG: DUF309 domain-containing protein, partial [Planctomycetota bacterium]